MRKSIGAKIFTVMAVMGLLFVIGLAVNLNSLTTISDDSEQVSLYLTMEQTKGVVSTAFQQAQLYANLTYFKKDTGEFPVVHGKLKTAVDEMTSYMDEIQALAQQSEDTEVISAVDAWASSMDDFASYCMEIYNHAANGEFETAMSKVDSLKGIKDPVQAAEDAYDALIIEKQAEIAADSQAHITESVSFNVVDLVLYVIVFVGAILIVLFTVAKPAKDSGKKIGQIVNQLQNNEGDLTERLVVKTKDEVGQMATGINGFLEQLQRIMKTLKKESDNLMQSAKLVREEINESNENVAAVSATMEEMSASIEEISATLDQIVEGSDNVLADTRAMMEQAASGADMIEDIKVRAGKMYQNTVEGKESTNQAMLEIRETLLNAVEESKSVEKINQLTGEILNISSQTNLLALNASIEAARAGEAGRGFAVVADEIRNLADNSRNTASNIQEISNLVTLAVERLAENAEQMLRFVDEKIMTDYDGFVAVVQQYAKDAENMNEIISEFSRNAGGISDTMETMNMGINDIAIAIDESAKGVTSVAEGSSELVAAMVKIRQESEANMSLAEQLSDEVNKFKRV